MVFENPPTRQHPDAYSTSDTRDGQSLAAERRLRAAFDQIVADAQPSAKARAALGLGPDATNTQVETKLESAYENLAVGALRLAYAHGITGPAALDAATRFLAQLRARLENHLASSIAGYATATCDAPSTALR